MIGLIDSDYDEDDEIQQSEMDEIFSISQHSEDFEKDQSEFDSDLDETDNQFFSFGLPNSKAKRVPSDEGVYSNKLNN